MTPARASVPAGSRDRRAIRSRSARHFRRGLALDRRAWHAAAHRAPRLAGELRGLRATAGLTRDDVSDQTGINPATLYRIETAKVRPQRRTLIALLDKYGVTDEGQRSELIALSRQATQLGWLHAFGSELSEQYTTYISFEAEARSVRNYESLFVPGLLQTEDYARAVIKGVLPLASDDEVEHRVEARAASGVTAKEERAQAVGDP